MRKDIVWKSDELCKLFLENVRGEIPFAFEQIDLMTRLLKANVNVQRFLDLGCGNGILAGAILEHYPNALGVLVDFSESMLSEAKQLLANHSNLKFVNSDFSNNSWIRSVKRESPYDAIVSGYAIHHQSNKRKRQLFHEIFQLLNPGGMFINLEHVASNSKWIESINNSLFVDSLLSFHHRKGSMKSREQVMASYVHRQDKAANILAPVETQCVWLRRCGFTDVDCYFKVFELAIFGGRRHTAPKRENSLNHNRLKRSHAR
jgi:ubiquinone/menaquinone biosynthesis C-methylase UbiE